MASDLFGIPILTDEEAPKGSMYLVPKRQDGETLAEWAARVVNAAYRGEVCVITGLEDGE